MAKKTRRTLAPATSSQRSALLELCGYSVNPPGTEPYRPHPKALAALERQGFATVTGFDPTNWKPFYTATPKGEAMAEQLKGALEKRV